MDIAAHNLPPWHSCRSISILGRLHELASFVSRASATDLGLYVDFDWLLKARRVNTATQLPVRL